MPVIDIADRPARLTPLQWTICATAAIGFAFQLFAGSPNDSIPPAMVWKLGRAYFEP